MKLEQWLRLIAGLFVLAAVSLSVLVHPYWNLLALFVAANLIQSAFTGWCLMMALLRKLGVQEEAGIVARDRRDQRDRRER